MNIYGKTDIGRVRESNQDAFAFGKLSEHLQWAVVCDGMGGANGGNVASEIAVRTVEAQLNESLSEHLDAAALQRLLSNVIENANMAIYHKGQAQPELKGMGTTLVLAAIVGERVYVAHVGDSRAYLISRSECSQITTDHSMVQMMVDMGTLTEDEAKSHPKKNVITRALGIEPAVEIDFCECTQESGEILLLCSDGLTNFLEPDKMTKLVLENELPAVPALLIDRANENGGGDNVTVVVIGQ